MTHAVKNAPEDHPLYKVTVAARKALKSFIDPTIVLMSPAHGFMGEELDDPGTLFNVVSIALVPHPGRVQGPQARMNLALDCGGVVGANPNGGVIKRVETGTMLPRYRVADLPPADIVMVLEMYAQIRIQHEGHAVPDEVWDCARPSDG